MIHQIEQELAQQIVNTLKDVCGHHINFIDLSGKIFASTDEKRIGDFHEVGKKAAQSGESIEVTSDDSFTGSQKGVNLPIHHKDTIIAVIGISGNPDEVRKFAHLAERITNLLIREKELSSFRQSQAEMRHYIINTLINREETAFDYLSNSLNELGISKIEEKRMLLIQIDSKFNLSNIPGIEQKILQFFKHVDIRLYTYHYPNEYLAVIEDSIFQNSVRSLEVFTTSNKDMIKLAVGKRCQIYDLAESYTSCRIAMKSLSFTTGCYVIYDELALEIILSSLDAKSRDELMDKTLKKLNEEEHQLLSSYFEEDMSLAETCRKLFLHKNTLQYKLDKIHQKCGYNPRKFRDAVILYLAVKSKT